MRVASSLSQWGWVTVNTVPALGHPRRLQVFYVIPGSGVVRHICRLQGIFEFNSIERKSTRDKEIKEICLFCFMFILSPVPSNECLIISVMQSDGNS